MNKEIATSSAVLDDLVHRPKHYPVSTVDGPLQIGTRLELPYVKTPQEICIHRIRNLDHEDTKSVLLTQSKDTRYVFEELEALRGSKVFVDWTQYSLYGRATFAKFKSRSILQVENIHSVEALFSIAPIKHIIVHHNFSEFYVSEFWTSETFLNAALDFYQIPLPELLRVDWKTDSAKSCTFVLTLIRQSLLDCRFKSLSSSSDTPCILISHYDFVRSTSLEEYKVRHFCPALSPDNFGFLLITLTQLAQEHSFQDILPSFQQILEPFDVQKLYLFRNATPCMITFAIAFDSILSCQGAYLRLNNSTIMDYKLSTRFPVMDLLAYPSLPSSLRTLSIAEDSIQAMDYVLPRQADNDGDFRLVTPFSLDSSRIQTAEATPVSSPVLPGLFPQECNTCCHFHDRSIVGMHSSPSSPVSTTSGDGVTKQPYTTLLTNQIIPWRIQAGLDSRTTCMLRNIPNKYTQAMLIDFVNETHFGLYDFLYLRMDFKNKCNVGYAFINFVDPKAIICFSKRVKGSKWHLFNTYKIADLTYANIQGFDALVRKFRNSSVMEAALEYRPKLFSAKGESIGKEIPFPLPDKPHLRRS